MGKIISNAVEWSEALGKQPISDIYFDYGYHKSFETSMQRTALAYTHTSGQESFFYPFMQGEIKHVGAATPPQKCHDIETVYGYSAMLSTTTDASFLTESYQAFHEYCATENIACEMLRFNPLIANEKFKSSATQTLLNRHTVSVNLTENLWQNYHPKLRNDLLRAEKLGLQFAENAMSHDEFAELYNATMKRINATEFYFFDDAHYHFYTANNATKILTITENGKPLAAAIFMFSGEFMHYHLAASAESPNQPYASKWLIHKAAEWGIAHGYKTLHLGGGRTAAEDDSLLFFKKRFATTTHDFLIGKTIFNHELYTQLCDLWQNQAKITPPKFLQLYRLPVIG